MKASHALNDMAISKLTDVYQGKRTFTAKNPAFSFDLLDDIWQIGTNDRLNLSWMRKGEMDTECFLRLRQVFAHRAGCRAYETVSGENREIRFYGNAMRCSKTFQEVFHQRSAGSRNNIKYLFSSLNKRITEDEYELKEYFSDIIQFLETQNATAQDQSNNIFDPTKGVYSEIEYNSIVEQMRIATSSALLNLDIKGISTAKVNRLAIIVAVQLMVTTLRRPTQLVQLKWSDLLPLGVSFADHRDTGVSQIPTSECLFSDIDSLHLRTFKGKDGLFRGNAERRSHRLETDLSTLILKYRYYFKQLLAKHLGDIDIKLEEEEWQELMFRCPIFPSVNLFRLEFGSKKNLFLALGLQSDALHKHSVDLMNTINQLMATLSFKSDRIDPKKLKLSNNRHRHHVLTNGARQGLTSEQLSCITGVSPIVTTRYIDLDFNARLDIDQALATKEVYTKFGTIPVTDLLKKAGYSVRNEYDEEIGIVNNPHDCTTCKLKLGAPLGCYPCDNFRPHEDADHNFYLEKAERKYQLNSSQGDQATVNKLRIIILYIRATIDICNQRKQDKSRIPYGHQ